MKNRVIAIMMLLVALQVCAKNYCEKYASVVEHYSKQDSDSMKLKAALYLIDNMQGHKSPTGDGLSKYIDTLRTFPHKTTIGKLSRAWTDCHKNGQKVSYVDDHNIITPEYLIKNIDEAFEAWQTSPWNSEVGFAHFCRYILPYKTNNEVISTKWRQELRDKYKDVIADKKEMRATFAALYKAVMQNVSNSSAFAPISLDALSYDHIGRANCEQRCILLTAVMRAFAIPAAIDYVPIWADYSGVGHSWVALVMEDGTTYTMNETDEEPMMYNTIDASLFASECSAEETSHIPYQIKSKKGVSKIYRKLYERNALTSKHRFPVINDPYIHDVSLAYGLTGQIKLKVEDNSPVFLCTYVTGKDWIPIAVATPTKREVTFRHLGTDIVYLPLSITDGKYTAFSTPILLTNDNQMEHFPMFAQTNLTRTNSINIDRKYPLCNYMPNQWKNMVGAVFEGDNTPDFTSPDTLAVISSMPYGTTTISLNSDKAYRCIRFKCPDGKIALLAELEFIGAEGTVKGKAISEGVDINTIKYLSDNDCETRIKARKDGYWVGADFRQEKNICSIRFSPVSDGNGIQPYHLYELYGFDTRWRLLGRAIGKETQVTFKNVPQGALLLLKDKTKGKEERIFIYHNGKQIWY